MNINSPKAYLAGYLALAILLPLVSMAQDSSDRSGDRPNPAAANALRDRDALFCEQISDRRDQVLDRLSDRAEQVRDRGDSRNDKVDTRRDERLSKLDNHRDKRDAARSNRYDALRAKATTAGQKEAVEEFIGSAEELLAERREAMDAAITAFEEGVAELKEQMQEATDALETEVEDEINDIFDAAADACERDADFSEIRSILTSGMQTMRANRSDRRANYSFRDELEALREERRLAFAAAKQVFIDGMTDAKATLRAAFSGNTEQTEADDDEADSADE